MKKYKKILIGTVKAPKASEDEDKLSESDVEAREQNELAYTELLLSCKEVVCFGLIDESKTEDLPDGDARLAWSKLMDKFEPKTNSSRANLKTSFQNCKMESGQDPDVWIRKLEVLRQKYNFSLPKEEASRKIPDKDVIEHVLEHVTEDYAVQKEVLQELYDNGKLTLKKARDKLNTRYKQLAKSEDQDSMLMFKQFKGNCRNCGKQGHKAENCWDKAENASKRPDWWKNRSGLTKIDDFDKFYYFW